MKSYPKYLTAENKSCAGQLSMKRLGLPIGQGVPLAPGIISESVDSKGRKYVRLSNGEIRRVK